MFTRRYFRTSIPDLLQLGMILIAISLASSLDSEAQVVGQLANFNPKNYDNAKIMTAIRQPGSDLVILAAHRGTHALAGTTQAVGVPENSLMSIGAAAQAGWEAIEIDVKVTQDGVPILSHDSTWGREWCGLGGIGRGTQPYNPFIPPGDFNNDGKNPLVADTALTDTRSVTGATYLRDSVSVTDNTTYHGCTAPKRYLTGEYPPTLQNVYDYIRSNHIQMVLELDIKDAATSKAAWQIVQQNKDDRGRSAVDWTIFKVPAIAFSNTNAYLDTFGSTYSQVKFNPVFHTAGIAPPQAGGADVEEGDIPEPSTQGFGSESAMSLWLQNFKEFSSSPGHPAPIDIVAIEVSMKEPGNTPDGGILEGVRTTVINTSSGTISQFHSVPEYYVGGDPTQGQYFRSNNGVCCYEPQEYLYNNKNKQGPFGHPYDHDDHRGEMPFLIDSNSARMITTDRPDAFAQYLTGRGLRNTNKYVADSSTPPVLNSTPMQPLTLTAQSSNAHQGDNVQLIAYVYPSNAAGQLILLDGSANVGTAGLDNGYAVFTVNSISSGTHQFTAIYGDPSTNATVSSNKVSILVASGSPGMANAPIRLMPLGASITFGTGSSDRNGYREDLFQGLASATGGTPDFVGRQHPGPMADSDNEGYPGFRIDQIAPQEKCAVPAFKPNVVTIIAGTNDIQQSYSLSTAPNRLSTLAQNVLSDSPKAIVLVLAIPPNADSSNPSLNANTTAFNNAARDQILQLTSSGKHVVFVDAGLTTADIGPDYIPPNDGGYAKIAAAFLNGISVAIGNGWLQTPDAEQPLANGCAAADSQTSEDARWEDHGVSFPNGFGSGNKYRFADVNKDKLPEFFVVKPDQSWSFYWNGGRTATGWTPWGAGVTRAARASGLVGNMLRFADIDGDGEPDCIQVDLQGHLDAWVWDDSQPAGQKMCAKRLNPGSFDVPDTGTIPSDTTITFADVDGDGRPDYLLTDTLGGVRVWFNEKGPDMSHSGDASDAQPGPSPLHWISAPGVPHSATSPRQFRWADINGDGKADLILITAGGGANAWLNQNSDPLGGIHLHNIGSIAADKNVPPEDVQFVDVGGNGKADFVRVGWTGVMHIWLNRLTAADFSK